MILVMKWAMIGISLVMIAGCSGQKTRIVPPPEPEQTIPERNYTESGVFLDRDGSIYLKYKDYPAISVLDELFNKIRFNYAISANNLSLFPDNYNLTICEGCENGVEGDWKSKKQKRFADLTEFLRFLTNSISKMPLTSNAEKGCFPLVCSKDLLDPAGLVAKVKKGLDPISKVLLADPEVSKALSDKTAGGDDRLQTAILAVLNDLIANRNLYSENRQKLPAYNIQLPDRVADLLQAASSKKDPGPEQEVRVLQVNRYLVEQFFPTQIQRSNRIGFRYTGDGIELFDVNPLLRDTNAFVFKKIFLNSLTSPEAQVRLSKLYSLEPLDGAPPPAEAKVTRENGMIVSLPQQNALALLAKESVIQQINQVIFSLDANFESVMVETKVFEYDDSLSRQLGMAVEYSRSNASGQSYGIKTFFGQGIDALVMPILSFGSNKSKDEVKSSILTNLSLYANNNAVRITAEPRLVLKPGARAEVRLLTNKYILTNPAATASGDLKVIDTGITFILTPTILSDKRILMDVELEQSEFVPTIENTVVQVTNKNTIKTSIVVRDGELFSIGGIKAKRASMGRSGIPYLKDLPWGIGYLFGSEQVTSTDVNIEFMIRPTIRFKSEDNRKVLGDVLKTDGKILNNLGRDADVLSKELNKAVGGVRVKP